MNTEQRAAAERLIEGPRTSSVLWGRAVIALLRELAEVPVSEPVAWLVMDESGYVQHAASWRDAAHEHINDAINEHDLVCARTWRVVPVYAAPQQRKPLSADQIRDAVNDHAFWATSKNFIFRIARAIERAHGITGEPT